MASLHRSIDVVVHCVRDGDRRYVEQVLYDPELKERTVGSDNPLFLAAE